MFSSLAVTLGIAMSLAGVGQANAVETTVDLGDAQSFAVLASQTVTNTGPSTVSGDVGVTPLTAITGFPPGSITGAYGLHSNTQAAIDAAADLLIAYNNAKSRTPADDTVTELAGETLTPGLYSGGALSNSGTLTLNGEGSSDAVWIFQATSTLITLSDSKIELINGADACNVFWQVETSATLGTNSTMVGTIMAQQSIAAQTGATVEGRLLALNGAVTLDSNTINAAKCAGTAVEGGTKPIPVETPPAQTPPAQTPPAQTPPAQTPPVEGPVLAETGADVGLSIIAMLTLVGGGVVLLLISGNRFQSRRSERNSQ